MKKNENQWIVFLKLFKQILSDKTILTYFLLTLLMLIVGVIANVTLPLLFKKVADKLYYKEYSLVIFLTLGYGLIWIISQAQIHIKDFFSSHVELRFTAEMLVKGMDNILSLPMETFYKTYNTGTITSLIQRSQQSFPSLLVKR